MCFITKRRIINSLRSIWTKRLSFPDRISQIWSYVILLSKLYYLFIDFLRNLSKLIWKLLSFFINTSLFLFMNTLMKCILLNTWWLFRSSDTLSFLSRFHAELRKFLLSLTSACHRWFRIRWSSLIIYTWVLLLRE